MYISSNVAEMIKNRAKYKGVSIKKMLEDIGLGFNTMSNMKTSMPKADNLAKIADYLDCSVDYLLGRTDCPDVNTNSDKVKFPKEESFLIAAEDGKNVVKKADKKPVILE